MPTQSFKIEAVASGKPAGSSCWPMRRNLTSRVSFLSGQFPSLDVVKTICLTVAAQVSRFNSRLIRSGFAMKHIRLPLSSMVILAFAIASDAFAQEMRVYTTVKNLASPKPEVVAHSLTLFHAGKVYDYVDEVREVTVYEPSQQRFVLLSGRRGTQTEVAQSEVRQFLNLARQEGQKRLEEADEKIGPSQVRSLAWLNFQLRPEFSVSFDQSKSELQLLAHNCRYAANGVAPPAPEVAETYLRFADAMAELNSVLHPRAMLPAPRMKLNDELRHRTLLPVSVELHAELERPLWLQARHEWTWKFSSSDRELISKWEKELADPSVRKVSFRQYQHDSLSAEVARRK